jgi:hypothetical protein
MPPKYIKQSLYKSDSVDHMRSLDELYHLIHLSGRQFEVEIVKKLVSKDRAR